MAKKKFYLIFSAYILLLIFCLFYLYEHIASLIAVLNYNVGENFVFLYHGYENIFIFRLIKNVMPLGTSVEIEFSTILSGIYYIVKSLGVVELLFLIFIVYLIFFNYYIEENQKDIVYIYNALMTLFATFLASIIIYIIIFLLAMIFLKILYETAFLIISIVIITIILIHLFILVKTGIKLYKFLKFR